jgi:hypothetical protein
MEKKLYYRDHTTWIFPLAQTKGKSVRVPVFQDLEKKEGW